MIAQLIEKCHSDVMGSLLLEVFLASASFQ
jgi:hypothetical protein